MNDVLKQNSAPQQQVRIKPLFIIATGFLAVYGIISQNLEALVASPLPEGLVWLLLYLAGYPLVLFFPGAIFALRIFKRKPLPLSLFVLASFGIQFIILYISTTAMKIGGVTIDKSSFLAAEIILFVLAFFVSRGISSVNISMDLRRSKALLVILALAITVVAVIYYPRLRFNILDYWVIDRVEQIDFPAKTRIANDIDVVYASGLKEIGARRFRFESPHAIITLTNTSQREGYYYPLIFMRGEEPAHATFMLNNAFLEKREMPQRFTTNRTHVLHNQIIFGRRVSLTPGTHHFRINLDIQQSMLSQISFEMQDYSNMTKPAFIREFKKQNGFLNVGHFYDLNEDWTHLVSFNSKNFLWANRFATGEREGYYILALPLPYYQLMLAWAAFPPSPLGPNLMFFITLFLMGVALLFLIKYNLPAPRLDTCILFVTFMVNYSIIWSNEHIWLKHDHYCVVYLIMAIACLAAGRYALFIVFGLFCTLSAPPGFLLICSTIFFYLLYFRQWKMIHRILAPYALLVLAFVLSILVWGKCHDLLPVWKRELMGEYMYKSLDEVPCGFTGLGNLRNLIKWTLGSSCLVILGLWIKGKDRITNLLLSVAGVYFFSLLLKMHTRVYRLHYAIPIAVLVVAAFLRKWAIQDRERLTKNWRFALFRWIFVLLAVLCTIFIFLRPLDYPLYHSIF